LKEYRQHHFECPMGATELLLVRHGESRAAVPGSPFPLVDGQGDPELAVTGRAQAQRVGERLKNYDINAVYVTNLRRTQETADPLLAHLDLTAHVEPDLREVHLGEWEAGVFRVKVHEGDPLYAQMRKEERWDVIPGAESHSNIKSRVSNALNKIIATHPNELVVLVLHGGIIGHILAEATMATPFAFNGCDNASVSHLVSHENKFILRGYNDISHLVGLESDSQPT
jgi:probable phosphoglycerate mutase